VAKNGYRPRKAAVQAKYKDVIPQISLFTIDDEFGGWKRAQETHFADAGIFDQIYKPSN
jgi:sulfate transport system substrate-binding protein